MVTRANVEKAGPAFQAAIATAGWNASVFFTDRQVGGQERP
jgi:hypothetical protein